MCDPVTAAAAGIGALQSGLSAQAANKQASRDYQYRLKVRERNWMGERSLYQTKLVQHAQQVDLANVAAQRAYTRTQISLNNAQSLAILENQNDWMKMIANEGDIQVSAAARGIRGKGIGRGLAMNKGAFGMTQAMRTRGLTMAQDDAKETNDSIRRQLKGFLNESFGNVAIQPVPEVAPPKPVMQNAMLAAILGGAQSGLAAYGSMDKTDKTLSNYKKNMGSAHSGNFSGGSAFGDLPSSKIPPSSWGKLPSTGGYTPPTFPGGNPYGSLNQSNLSFSNLGGLW